VNRLESPYNCLDDNCLRAIPDLKSVSKSSTARYRCYLDIQRRKNTPIQQLAFLFSFAPAIAPIFNIESPGASLMMNIAIGTLEWRLQHEVILLRSDSNRSKHIPDHQATTTYNASLILLCSFYPLLHRHARSYNPHPHCFSPIIVCYLRRHDQEERKTSPAWSTRLADNRELVGYALREKLDQVQ
jgi:hypothetical protein